uniref:Uncharacterized protein n=1 Tax=Setaria viridis TaxID=4556 RepID=A0A4U6VJ82_SETVI|nr:hypothetical protein SEVIR_3G415400v2 [Setaria viridis]
MLSDGLFSRVLVTRRSMQIGVLSSGRRSQRRGSPGQTRHRIHAIAAGAVYTTGRLLAGCGPRGSHRIVDQGRSKTRLKEIFGNLCCCA